jgi:hypothetical protein
MASHSDVIDRFVIRGRPIKGSHIFADDDSIYSYGTHFPMAVAVDDRKMFVVNGDTWGSTTSHHQSMVRGALSRNSSYDQVIIPFSAMRAARIDPRSVEVIEEGVEINESGCRTCDIMLYGEEYNNHFYQYGNNTGKNKRTYMTNWCDDDTHPRYYRHGHDNPDYDPTFKPHDIWSRHLLAPSLITATQSRVENVPESDCASCGDPVSEHPDGWKDNPWRHRYYAQQITIREKIYLLSGFDETARAWGGGYFLSQLPHKVKTIDEAILSLAPKEVHKAWADGKFVKRQGDIFGIPDSEMTTRKLNKIGSRLGGARFYLGAHRPRLLETNHYATEAFTVTRHGKEEIWARGCLYHLPTFRQPDHKKIVLGKIWHRIYRNTAVGSWAAEGSHGRVD